MPQSHQEKPQRSKKRKLSQLSEEEESSNAATVAEVRVSEQKRDTGQASKYQPSESATSELLSTYLASLENFDG
jgi:hypothetical protein